MPQHIGKLSLLTEVPLFNFLVQGEPLKHEMLNLASKKTRNNTSLCGAQRKYFDILNHLGIDHQCDGCINRQNYDSNSLHLTKHAKKQLANQIFSIYQFNPFTANTVKFAILL